MELFDLFSPEYAEAFQPAAYNMRSLLNWIAPANEKSVTDTNLQSALKALTEPVSPNDPLVRELGAISRDDSLVRAFTAVKADDSIVNMMRNIQELLGKTDNQSLSAGVSPVRVDTDKVMSAVQATEPYLPEEGRETYHEIVRSVKNSGPFWTFERVFTVLMFLLALYSALQTALTGEKQKQLEEERTAVIESVYESEKQITDAIYELRDALQSQIEEFVEEDGAVVQKSADVKQDEQNHE